ncbi:MAG: epoxyqueuosine reductase QueH [bacterium]|nr:epoxyqueuosine reductase QueH [bacterium]
MFKFSIKKLFAKKPKLLLHVCCVGFGVYVSQTLKEDYDVTLYFYNPNVWPKQEYDKRLDEANRIAERLKLKIIHGDYTHDDWLQSVKGHEGEPERGERCLVCFSGRLDKAAIEATKLNCDYFGTTLTTSPHKDALAINEIGEQLAEKYGLKFLNRDFKKKDGFKRSCELSRELGLHRQTYCGCEFSRRVASQTANS